MTTPILPAVHRQCKAGPDCQHNGKMLHYESKGELIGRSKVTWPCGMVAWFDELPLRVYPEMSSYLHQLLLSNPNATIRVYL